MPKYQHCCDLLREGTRLAREGRRHVEAGDRAALDAWQAHYDDLLRQIEEATRASIQAIRAGEEEVSPVDVVAAAVLQERFESAQWDLARVRVG
jgi:hypothetical protein